jgi:hypothetical protein
MTRKYRKGEKRRCVLIRRFHCSEDIGGQIGPKIALK